MYGAIVENKNLEEIFLLPISCKMIFKVNTWLAYSIAYGWTFAGLTATEILKVFLSQKQFMLCIYAFAVNRDLRQKVLKLKAIRSV